MTAICGTWFIPSGEKETERKEKREKEKEG